MRSVFLLTNHCKIPHTEFTAKELKWIKTSWTIEKNNQRMNETNTKRALKKKNVFERESLELWSTSCQKNPVQFSLQKDVWEAPYEKKKKS